MILLPVGEVRILRLFAESSDRSSSAMSRLPERSNVFKSARFNAKRFGRLKLASPQLLRYSSFIY